MVKRINKIEIISLRKKSLSVEEITKRTGITIHYVRKILKEVGLEKKIEKIETIEGKKVYPTMRCPNCDEIVKLTFNPLKQFKERFGKRCPRCGKRLFRMIPLDKPI